jgi:hypothetical protein
MKFQQQSRKHLKDHQKCRHSAQAKGKGEPQGLSIDPSRMEVQDQIVQCPGWFYGIGITGHGI